MFCWRQHQVRNRELVEKIREESNVGFSFELDF